MFARRGCGKDRSENGSWTQNRNRPMRFRHSASLQILGAGGKYWREVRHDNAGRSKAKDVLNSVLQLATDYKQSLCSDREGQGTPWHHGSRRTGIHI